MTVKAGSTPEGALHSGDVYLSIAGDEGETGDLQLGGGPVNMAPGQEVCCLLAICTSCPGCPAMPAARMRARVGSRQC